MSGSYQIVFYGDLLDGWEETQVREGMAALFKVPEERVAAMFGGTPTVLKKGIDEGTAEKYRQALAKVGAVGRVEPMEPAERPSELALEPMEAAPPPPPPPTEQPPPRAKAAPPPKPEPERANFYAPPATPLVRPQTDEDEPVLGDPRKRSAGSGWDWLVRGFGYFMNSPGAWLASIVIMIVVFVALAIVPFGQVLGYVLSPLFVGGLMIGCRAIDRGDGLSVGDLFAGFKHQTGRLAGLGALYLLANAAVLLLVFALMFLMGGGLVAMQQMGMTSDGVPPDPADVSAFVGTMLLFVLIMLALLLPVIMGFWFAPALIALHDTPVWESVKLSFLGCLRNWLPFLVYGIIALVLSFVAALPFGLGFLVLGPAIIASIYVSHKDIYLHGAAPR